MRRPLGSFGSRGLLRSLLTAPVLVATLALVGCGGDGAADTVDGDAIADADRDVQTEVEVEPSDAADATDILDDMGGDGDGADAAETSDAGETTTGFPAEGLLIRILEPGAHGTAAATGPTVLLSGVLFGEATALVWQAGGQSGSATPARFWQAGPVALSPGDNRITITATDGVTSVGDSVVVTYNPAFRFDEGLSARPGVLWRDEPSDVVFTVSLSRTGQVDLARLELVEVDADGGELAVLGVLTDDGDLAGSGDEIEQDGVFTRSLRVTCDGEVRRFRARVPVTGAGGTTLAVSPVLTVPCLARLSRTSCDEKRVLLDAAGAALEGGADPAVVAASLTSEAIVAEAGAGASGEKVVWVAFDDGVLGAAVSFREGVRGAPAVGAAAARVVASASTALELPVLSKRAMVLSPMSGSLTVDESEDLVATLREVACPRYDLESGQAIVGADADLARLRGVSSHGLVALATHGAELFSTLSPARMRALGWAHIGPQEVLWSGQQVACDVLLERASACVLTAQDPQGGCPEGSRCLVTRGIASDSGSSGQGICVDDTQADLRLGRAVMTNRGLAVTPAFFSAWRGTGFPASLVHLGACGSIRNGSLASALYAAGARAVSGFSGPVGDAFAADAARALVAAVTTPTVGEVVDGRVDPEHGGQWRLFGATNLSVSGSALINGGFEQALTGWRTSGDGRSLSKFGSAQAVSGKSMGLVSTGLGFSLASGELRQTFCVPAGASRLALSWKFVSEEFKEWCGTTKFQDRFRASLIDEVGDRHTLLEVAVDDLCGYGDGTCAACPNPRPCDPACDGEGGCYSQEGVCGGTFNCQCGREFTGLTASPIGFDQGGVYEVMWRETVRDVARFAGRGAVTLVLGVEDLGDSLFDTAVLLDEIKVD